MAGGIPIVTVDAFTTKVFQGNPAGVCVLEKAAPGPWMQRVAAELNLSETAFLHPEGSGWSIRWFSPAVEVPLCGHATLSAAHVLWETGRASPKDRLTFDSLSGPLAAWKEGDQIGLDFPVAPPAVSATEPGIGAALRAEPSAFWATGAWRIAEFQSERTVAKLAPDFAAMARLEPMVFAVTAPGDSNVDYVCRVFGPKVGIDEDPVTGSIQCALGPLWGKRLGRTELRVRQLSARGGELDVRLVGDRVHILGYAVTVFTGTLAA